MKKSKSKKWLWAVLGAVLLLLVGTIGYLSGQLSSIKKDTEKAHVVKNSKVVKHSSSKDKKESSSSEKMSSKVSSQSTNTSGPTLNADGFDGYHNVHELANAGTSVTGILMDKYGMTSNQAIQYVKQHLQQLENQNLLTSGEIQSATLNEDNQDNQNNNQNGPSMHQDGDGNWEDQYGHVYEHFTPEEQASLDAQANND